MQTGQAFRCRSLAHGPALCAWRSRTRVAAQAARSNKFVWVEPLSKEALTAGLESGVSTFLFRGDEPSSRQQAQAWAALGRSTQLFITPQDGCLTDLQGGKVGRWVQLRGPADVKALEAQAAAGSLQGDIVIETEGWKVIPAENLVALLQALQCAPAEAPEGSTGKPSAAASEQPAAGRPGHAPGRAEGGACRLIAAVGSASDALLMLGALEAGTDGVLLRTGDDAEVRRLMETLRQSQQGRSQTLPLQPVRVTKVEPVGAGDRACVDLACLMQPGEGMLVGSLAAGLFLVHSECEESQYINARPFRVNAGPVHAYLQAPGGRTAYLSELRSGAQVQVVDPAGRQRTAVVGRVKVESRPLVLVEAVSESGQHLSILLQNAETVKLVGLPPTPRHTGPTSPTQPGATGTTSAQAPASRTSSTGIHAPLQPMAMLESGDARLGSASVPQRAWRAISVSELAPGDQVLALLQGGARHTGIAIQEFIVEK